MKHLYLFTITCLLAAMTVSAAARQSGESRGVKVGATLVTVSGTNPGRFPDLHPVIGLTGGLYYRREFRLNLSLGIELLATTKGYAYNPVLKTPVGPPPDAVFGTTGIYLDLPVLAAWQVSHLLEIYLGSYLGILCQCWEWHQFNSSRSRYLLEADDVRMPDFGYLAGVAVNSSRFTVDLRYTHGSIFFLEDRLHFTNRQLTLLVGRKFRAPGND